MNQNFACPRCRQPYEICSCPGGDPDAMPQVYRVHFESINSKPYTPPQLLVTSNSTDRKPLDQYVKDVCLEVPDTTTGALEAMRDNHEFLSHAFGRLLNLWLENTYHDDRAKELNYILFGTEEGPVTEVKSESST